MPRQPACRCGTCRKCKARAAARAAYQSLTMEQRRDLVGGRDPEKVRAADRVRYERDKKKRLAAQAAYRQTPEGRAAGRRAARKWIEANPEKRHAQIAVGNALRDGKLVKGPCASAGPDCKGRVHAHHEDYAKPLEVEWLCDHHHKLRHKEE